MTPLTCFKAYDIRGRLGIDLDENIAYRIGAAFAVALEAKTVVLGRDVRASSEALANSVAQRLFDQGCEVASDRHLPLSCSIVLAVDRKPCVHISSFA